MALLVDRGGIGVVGRWRRRCDSDWV